MPERNSMLALEAMFVNTRWFSTAKGTPRVHPTCGRFYIRYNQENDLKKK